VGGADAFRHRTNNAKEANHAVFIDKPLD